MKPEDIFNLLFRMVCILNKKCYTVEQNLIIYIELFIKSFTVLLRIKSHQAKS